MIERASAILRHYRHAVIISLMCVISLVVAWFLLPSDETRIAALERDGKIGRAREMLQEKFAQGDRSPRTLFQLHRIHEHYGDLDNAGQVLELLAKSRPKDLKVQRQLLRHYKLVQDEPNYIALLRAQLALRHSDFACRELIGIHRRNDDLDAETQAIRECRAKGYRREDDLSRLAVISAASGDLVEAARILQSVDDRRWLKNISERILLFSALIEAGQANEAYRRGLRWLKGQPDDELALGLISLFVEAKQNALGIELAKAVGKPGNPVSLSIAEIMVDQVQYPAARAFLAGWLEKAEQMDTETATRFLNASVDSGDPLLALKGAERHGIDKFAQADLVGLAEALVLGAHTAPFNNVGTFLTLDTLGANPLLLAEIEFNKGRVDVARLLLTNVKADELDERRLELLALVNEKTGRQAAVTADLRKLRIEAPPTLGPAQRAANCNIRQQAVATRINKQRRRIARPVPGTLRAAPQGALSTPQTLQPIPFPALPNSGG